jgi:Acyl carrier protein phosphodiesterase
MATLLYITAHPLGPDVSYSMAAGEAFLAAYRDAHPNDEVIRLDLYAMDIPELDADVFSGWGKLGAGAAFGELTGEEQAKIARINELADQFASADKYVFVTPIWNYSYPPAFKRYIDTFVIAGKTFRYIPDIGRVGLLAGRKALHIQASGSFLSPGSPDERLEMGHRHLRVIMEFVGITDVECLYVEGMRAVPERADAIREKALRRAREIALSF